MQKNNNLTALRGIFIMMIVFHHLELYGGGGSLAVTFFFILGGFALSMGYADKLDNPEFSYCLFVRRRCEKFYPLHWLSLFAVLPLSLIAIFKGALQFQVALTALLPNVLLLQSLIPIEKYYFSFNAVSWYLSDTILFAFAFPQLAKFIFGLSKSTKVVFLSIVFVIYTAFLFLLPVEYWHAILYINPLVRIVDFILGIYLYLLYKKLSQTDSLWENACLTRINSVPILMLATLVVISCFVSLDTRMIAAIYWLPISILLIACGLSSKSWMGGVNYIILLFGLASPVSRYS